MSGSIDILMVTYNSPESTQLSLARLLETCDDDMRVWLWHNGDHAETLAVLKDLRSHPRVHRFHHSEENVRLWAPTNWLLSNAEGAYLSKVDDDNVLPHGWAQTLRKAHEDVPAFGAIGCWRFQEEDFDPELAAPKIRDFPGGHRLLQNLWVEGSCFLMKRELVDRHGALAENQSFTAYLRDLSIDHGWTNGWYYPFIRYENLDDPRAEHSLIKTDEDFRNRMPLTAQYNGIESVEDWTNQLRRSARNAQSESIDPRDWRGWRWYRRRARYWARRIFTGRQNKW